MKILLLLWIGALKINPKNIYALNTGNIQRLTRSKL